MNRLPAIAAAVALAAGIPAAGDDEAPALEARLRESVESSPRAAALMLELIDVYARDEQVFGLIRTASRFSRAQPDHPRRPEIVMALMDGYAVTSRHADVIATGRQFLEKYPRHALAAKARRHLADSLERTGRPRPAASHLAGNWSAAGTAADGLRALALFRKAGSAAAHKEATALALDMTGKLPAGPLLTDVGLLGLEMAGRSESWTDGLLIMKSLERRKAPMDAATRRTALTHTGHFASRLGQHENAVRTFREALAPDDADGHRRLIEEMGRANRPPGEVEKEVRRYLAEFPRRPDRHELLAFAAHQYARAGENAKARSLAAETMAADVRPHDIVRHFVNWCGDDHAGAERGLRDAIRKNPGQAWKLRAVLALEVCRDRMKDTAKARRAAREFFSHPPGNDASSAAVARYLLESAPDDPTFRKDLAVVLESARAHARLAEFQKHLWNWSPKDKSRHRAWQQARRSHQGDATAKLWRQALERGGRAGQACKGLLQRKLAPPDRQWVMHRLAYVYRHHLGGGARKAAAGHYEALCTAFPKDLGAAEAWLEAAAYAADKDDQLRAAATHLLALPPAPASHETWIRLVRTKDPAIVRKAIPWITKSGELAGNRLGHATGIGDAIAEAGMEPEAVAWWRAHMDLDPDHPECAGCAQRVAATLPPGEARALYESKFAADTPHHGRYAAALADLAFKAGDLDGMERVLEKSRARARQRPFRSWGIGEWPPRTWLEHARGAREWPADRKARVFRIVRDLDLGRVSTEAGLELLATAPRGLERLLAAQALILGADQHYDSWRRLYPHAQGALARDDFALAATVLNGLLHSVRSVGSKEMDEAGALLRKAYGRMGSLTSDIPPDSPIAPLLQIIVHRRLGEDGPAEEAYFKHRALFDQHRHELPVELVLFGAQVHIDQGTPADHERARDILGGWLIKFGESDKVDVRDKAQVQLLLARNHQRAQQYDVARAEFTTVLNIYPDQPEAIEARFGIGETYLAQKVHDQAEEIFAALAGDPNPQIAIRAEFLRGVLAIRQENNPEARAIFLAILERVPDTDLANETLYNLAEVYGLEKRHLTQLETLRAVGRLGRESKQWHTPGNALSVVVQDPDLGISRGETRIPVMVRTEPGNDEERSFLASGGAGKGIFLTEIPTALGGAEPGDGTLQVTGGDTITVDYPQEFKDQFQFEFLSSTRLRIASDGNLEAASSRILDEDDETFTEALKRELAADEAGRPKALQRPRNQIKPGNLIYARVRDGDRDLTAGPDPVSLKVAASSGDEVRVMIREEAAHGGVFSGMVRTGELPAGARASDSALDHNPLMAIDHSPDTAWRSEPDGAAPKSLTIDLKELRAVETVTLHSPDPEDEAPVRMHLRGSHDGRFGYTLAQFPAAGEALRMDFPSPGMRLRIYKTAAGNLKESYRWDEIVRSLAKEEPAGDLPVETLSWTPPEEGEEAFFLVWSGPFVQERDGGVRFAVTGRQAALMVDGRLELAMGEGGRTADIYARRGVHHLTAVAIVTSGGPGAAVTRARENPQSAKVTMRDFVPADFDPEIAPDLPVIEAALGGAMARDGKRWTLTMPAHTLRFVDVGILEFRGEAVAINHVEVAGRGATHVPPSQDVLELAGNDILELAPGDTVTVSYLDELTAGGAQRNRLLKRQLTATYHNGAITPVTYAFRRTGGGSVRGARRELMRIDPGERIVAEVVDYDLDTGLERDEVEVLVQLNGGGDGFAVTATETGPSTGVFVAEIDTAAADAPDPADRLVVKRGDRVYLRYKDEQNTFPGHAFHRETVVYVNEPTEALVQIIPSGRDLGGRLGFAPRPAAPDADAVSRIAYQLPLTVEVIDPDRAKDSGSTVVVDVETTQGTRVQVECVLSRSFAPPGTEMDEVRNPALFEGRFAGQVPLLLGGPDSPVSVPADGTVAKGGLGKVLPPPVTGPAAPLDDGEPSAPGILVLNVNGQDEFTARYRDEWRPFNESPPLEARAALFSPATLRITDEEYAGDAEIAFVGKKLFLWLEDPDLDLSGNRDKALVRLVTSNGEEESLELEETLSHSGVFSGSFPLKATPKPSPGNSTGEVECFFGGEITVGYLDNVPHGDDGEPLIELSIPVAVGTNGQLAAFSKVYKDEDLAIQTRFHIAESYFELFKSHLRLERGDEARADLAAGRRVLAELQQDYPNPRHAPRVSYLLGQFAQEMEAWDEAIASYNAIVRGHPEHALAPDAQYKLGQCHEKSGRLDEALEAYVTLAATYPKSPLIANVMLRINEHFYRMEDFAVAATVGGKFVERFPNHEWTPRMAFRIGQCRYKQEDYGPAGAAFDEFVKRFPEEELTAQALFWAGESYRMAKDIPNAFRRYNRCRWDFPESDAAKYSRGRLALPELLAQFEREANLNE